ncbi:DgyrCDS2629 [Dimorphilus gyrociliatus]|uniref:DgyrCDS2629 n=1 Tax=Dimorphilus gyrociliatus TaxID=2664684 RepID=A0A7I8VAV3_9ANNE|nr:DgyrCDS2629 [Dimorphilus gyrociliatus]
MEKVISNVSSSSKILKWVCFILLPSTTIIHIVSAATRNWYHQGDTMYGLFKSEKGTDVRSIDGVFLDTYPFYRFCQVGISLSLVFLLLSQLLALAMVCKCVESCKCKKFLLSFVILACLLTGTTWIVFVAKVSDEDMFNNPVLERFGYSFGLAIISTIFSFVTSIIIFKMNSGEERPQQRRGMQFNTPNFLQGSNQVPPGLYPKLGGDRGRSRSPVKGQAPPYTPYYNNEEGNRGNPAQPRMSRRDGNEGRYDEIVANPGYLEMP